jgi:hypothetical protein
MAKPDAPSNGASQEGSIYTAMASFFESDSWPNTPLSGRPVISLPFQGKNGQWLCFAQAREAQQQFIFYSMCPAVVPERRRPAIAEFITRANYGLIIGNFELDYGDGEIRYKTSIDVEGGELTSALIKQIVYANVLMMDQYLPGILAVLFNDSSPLEALVQVEN